MNDLGAGSIVVVADKKLRQHGTLLAHAISKVEDLKSSYWKPQVYFDNEPKLSGKNKLIFLGMTEASKPFYGIIKYKYENHGISWGWDGNKAIIDVTGSCDDVNKMRPELKDIYNEAMEKKSRFKQDAVDNVIAGAGAGVIIALIGANPSFWVILAVVYPFHLLVDYVRRRKRIKEMQFKYATLSFLKYGFDDFISGTQYE